MSSSESAENRSWRAGTRIDGRFELVSLQAHTGSAVVWHGVDMAQGVSTRVTIVQHPSARTPMSLTARQRDAHLAASISADCWIRVLGFGEWDGRSYLVAEDIIGESVEDVIRNAQARGQNLPPSLVVSIATKVLSALEQTAKVGMVHGDICTGSVFRCSGNVKVLCVGLARAHNTSALGVPLTHMAPEQVRGEGLDSSTDMWSLGVLMYRMVCGNYPFLPSSKATMRDAILQQPLLDQRAIAGPPLAAVISRALDRDPQRRYRNPQEMRQDLMSIDFNDMEETCMTGETNSNVNSVGGASAFQSTVSMLSGTANSGGITPRESVDSRATSTPRSYYSAGAVTPRGMGGDSSLRLARGDPMPYVGRAQTPSGANRLAQVEYEMQASIGTSTTGTYSSNSMLSVAGSNPAVSSAPRNHHQTKGEPISPCSCQITSPRVIQVSNTTAFGSLFHSHFCVPISVLT